MCLYGYYFNEDCVVVWAFSQYNTLRDTRINKSL